MIQGLQFNLNVIGRKFESYLDFSLASTCFMDSKVPGMGLVACLHFLLALSLCSSAEYKLSDSKLLLPYFSSASVNYTITGSGGSCYEWYFDFYIISKMVGGQGRLKLLQ